MVENPAYQRTISYGTNGGGTLRSGGGNLASGGDNLACGGDNLASGSGLQNFGGVRETDFGGGRQIECNIGGATLRIVHAAAGGSLHDGQINQNSGRRGGDYLEPISLFIDPQELFYRNFDPIYDTVEHDCQVDIPLLHNSEHS